MADAARADNFNTKFDLRTMKSLRKTVLMLAILFLPAFFAELKAQRPQDGAGGASTAQDAPSSPQQSGAQTRIRIPVNQVIVPVTVKDPPLEKLSVLTSFVIAPRPSKTA